MTTRRSTRLSLKAESVPTPAPAQTKDTIKAAKSNNTKPKAPAKPPKPPTKKRKDTEKEPTSATDPGPPMTPNSKRLKPAPSTTIPPTPRPANPHTSNATLSTPKGSRLTAYTPTTPLKWTTLPPPTSTTTTLLADGCAHLLHIAPQLRTLIAQNPCEIFSPTGLQDPIDPFTSLTSGIIGQQVSGAAASSIRRKFVALYLADAPEEYFPSPAAVAETEIATLRTAGLSQRKAEYILGLAKAFLSGDLSARKLLTASDQEVMDLLTAVRGIGPWSAEMFALFGLKRMDVFSVGDLGIQRGMAVLAGRDVAKLRSKGGKWKYMTEKEMREMSEPYKPYRSLFMWYMWRLSDVNVEVLST